MYKISASIATSWLAKANLNALLWSYWAEKTFQEISSKLLDNYYIPYHLSWELEIEMLCYNSIGFSPSSILVNLWKCIVKGSIWRIQLIFSESLINPISHRDYPCSTSASYEVFDGHFSLDLKNFLYGK